MAPKVKREGNEEKITSRFFKESPFAGPRRPVKPDMQKRFPLTPVSSNVSEALAFLRSQVQIRPEPAYESDDEKPLPLETEEIEVIRKENVFSEEVTESELDIIQKRVALQQRQFQEYEKREIARKSRKILAMYDYVSAEEIEEMLLDNDNDEDEVIVRLTQPSYLVGIRRIIAAKHSTEAKEKAPVMSDEQKIAYQQLLKKRSETLKKTTNEEAKKQYRMHGRLALDDALKQVKEHGIDPKAFEGWSQARVRAYQMIDQNPNSYYYRFNAPGEEQKKGQWTAEEKKLFHKRLQEVGANGQWGLFSMAIPGRVGYQCSNFYRLLVETKQIHDPNYVLDDKGKAHYLFDKKTSSGGVEKTFRTHSKHANGSGSDRPSRSRSGASTSVASRRSKRKRRSTRWGSDEDTDDIPEFDDDDSPSFTMKTWTTKRTRTRALAGDGLSSEGGENSGVDAGQDDEDEEEEQAFNPLPGFIDPITLDEVVKPAISIYGHVMGYESWVRCLTNWEGKKNICPLTKKKLTKRDLVILTPENWEEYKDKIVNL